jgi:hypothetical protein
VQHVRAVVSRTPPFDVHLKGLEKSWDHWLFLLVAEGFDDVVALHDLYTGSSTPICGPNGRSCLTSDSGSSSRSVTRTICSNCDREV